MRRIRTIVSGSSGNATLVEVDGRFVVIDVGCTLRALRAGLRDLGADLDDIAAILLTHEHYDHVKGLGPILRAARAEVYASEGTLASLDKTDKLPSEVRYRLLRAGHELDLPAADLGVLPFAVSHDAAEPLGFVFSHGEHRLGYMTDTGQVEADARRNLAGCGRVILESNYDPQMLRDGPYPYLLKMRIQGRQGHLSNFAAAELAHFLIEQGVEQITLAHLSRENNSPAQARRTFLQYLDNRSVDWSVEDNLTIAPRLQASATLVW
ncbi:MAG: MBL fold metallo-hydrolase [Clostridiaceae bacterium]|nr:MBL fold metallo-hydrolase [Clostridiaceae bacterium]